MPQAIDPAGLLRSMAAAALAGDIEAAAWLHVVAPDLAEDEGRLGAWLEQQQQEDDRRAALLDSWEDFDAAWERAGELDHYLETIHERTFYYSD